MLFVLAPALASAGPALASAFALGGTAVLGGELAAHVGYSGTFGIGVTFARLGLWTWLWLQEMRGALRNK
jgi:hypothetical protein